MKKIFPNIIFYKGDLPSWIISSSNAAYSPYHQACYISTRHGILSTIKYILHELGHHYFGSLGEKLW